MAVEVILPMLGETMDEGSIVKWYAQVGDTVRKGEPLYQVETDKAALDVESPADGVLRQILHDRGEKVKVLSVVGLISASGEAVASWEPAPSPQTPVESRPEEKTIAETGGGQVARPRVFVSPRARKLAESRGLELARVVGTGPGGRIVEKDVLAALAAQPPTTPVARKMAAVAGIDIARLSPSPDGRRVTRADVEMSLAKTANAQETPAPPESISAAQGLTGLRRIIAERMSASAHSTARVTLTTELNAGELIRLRDALRENLEAALGFVPSYSDVLVAVVARALRDCPYMNVRLSDTGISMLPQINVGVAVDTERGLLVPVIRDADHKGIVEIAKIARDLVGRARAGKSTPDDLSGGTFTITNLGMFDIDAFTPIINPPECAILGVGRIQERPVVCDGQICVGQVMMLSLTFDHRLVDGAPAARFLQRIKQLLELPALMLA